MPVHSEQQPNDDLVQQLLQSNLTLEKATLTLTDNVTQLTERLDKLLTLFDAAARNIQQLDTKEPLAQQLQTLLEQNKIIARGLVLIEKYIRDKTTLSFGTTPDTTKQLPKMI